MRRKALLMVAAAVLSLAGIGRVDAGATDPCVVQCGLCEKTCLECASCCLEMGADRAACVKTCLDCADICAACSKIGARGGPLESTIAAACAQACEKCAAECSKHKDDECCKACAEQCRKCAKECQSQAKAK